eukprot:1808728-Amphidinium_carterae.2
MKLFRDHKRITSLGRGAVLTSTSHASTRSIPLSSNSFATRTTTRTRSNSIKCLLRRVYKQSSRTHFCTPLDSGAKVILCYNCSEHCNKTAEHDVLRVGHQAEELSCHIGSHLAELRDGKGDSRPHMHYCRGLRSESSPSPKYLKLPFLYDRCQSLAKLPETLSRYTQLADTPVKWPGELWKVKMTENSLVAISRNLPYFNLRMMESALEESYGISTPKPPISCKYLISIPGTVLLQ